jgi:hypothetical protein
MIYDECNVTDIRSFNLMRYCEMINTLEARPKKAASIDSILYGIRVKMHSATSSVANSVYTIVSNQIYDIVHRDVIDSAYEEIYWMLSIEFSELRGE